ncbi:MAG: N-acetylmuramate alpha-1-phosphate uridylyltransferase MurU [Halothiobacillaceae bacterium]
MNAMILAAGRGERMRPLTDHCPKPMLPVRGKPLMAYHVERLASAGIKRIVINLAHLGAQIESHFGDGARYGVQIRYSHESTALETAGGIRKALDLLGKEPFLVVNGDIFTDYPFTRLISAQDTQPAHLVLTKNPAHNPTGDFHYTDAGRLVPVNKTQPPDPDAPGFTFTGIARYAPELFQNLPPEHHEPLAPLLNRWAREGLLSGEIHTGRWADVGTPQRLRELNETT